MTIEFRVRYVRPPNVPWFRKPTSTETATPEDVREAIEWAIESLEFVPALKIHEHSVELLGAADIARGWANGIRELNKERLPL